MKYLLDTNVCIDYMNGRYPQVVERVRRSAPKDLGVSSVVVAELRHGAEKSTRKERNHRRIDTLIADLEYAAFDLDAARQYGRARADLERRGCVIGPYDMMIAAHALALGCILVTDNVREFCRVEELRIENWREA